MHQLTYVTPIAAGNWPRQARLQAITWEKNGKNKDAVAQLWLRKLR